MLSACFCMEALNRTLLPSGVNAVGVSAELLYVRRNARPPSAGMTKTSALPWRSLLKAICRPSGDHTGFASYEGCVVRRVATPPAMPTVYISPL